MAFHPDYCNCAECISYYWGMRAGTAAQAAMTGSSRNAELMQQAEARDAQQSLLQQNARPSIEIMEMTRQATIQEPEPLYDEFDSLINRLSRGWKNLSTADQEKVHPRAKGVRKGYAVGRNAVDMDRTCLCFVFLCRQILQVVRLDYCRCRSGRSKAGCKPVVASAARGFESLQRHLTNGGYMSGEELKEAFEKVVTIELGRLRVFKYDCMDLEYKEVQSVKRVIINLPEGEEEVIFVE